MKKFSLFLVLVLLGGPAAAQAPMPVIHTCPDEVEWPRCKAADYGMDCFSYWSNNYTDGEWKTARFLTLGVPFKNAWVQASACHPTQWPDQPPDAKCLVCEYEVAFRLEIPAPQGHQCELDGQRFECLPDREPGFFEKLWPPWPF